MKILKRIIGRVQVNVMDDLSLLSLRRHLKPVFCGLASDDASLAR